MNKVIILIILLLSVSIVDFSQNYFLTEKSEKNIEKSCYEATKSYEEFKQCIENRERLFCLEQWLKGNRLDYPCRSETPLRRPVDSIPQRPNHTALLNDQPIFSICRLSVCSDTTVVFEQSLEKIFLSALGI